MPGRVEGKGAFITGAGRGQGRSHAIRLAEEGANVIAVDVLEDYPTVRYAMSSQADLDVTIRRIAARRSGGTVPASSASHARSSHVKRERARGCWRWATAS